MLTNQIASPMRYLQDARTRAMEAHDPMAKYCTMATVEGDDAEQARARTLVVRDVTDFGCLLYVNRSSKKNLFDAEKQNPKMELLFFYPSEFMQFRLRGEISFLPLKQIALHWQNKPYEAKLLDHYYARYQTQSTPVDNRATLIEGLAHLKETFPRPDTVPFPDNAAGLFVTATYLEVWQGAQDSIHDRQLFTRVDDQWQVQTLVP